MKEVQSGGSMVSGSQARLKLLLAVPSSVVLTLPPALSAYRGRGADDGPAAGLLQGAARSTPATAAAVNPVKITMVDAQTTIQPTRARIELANGSQVFTLISTPALAPPDGLSLNYDWSCPSKSGILMSAGASTSPAMPTITSGSNVATYADNAGLLGGEFETIICQVYYVTPENGAFPAERVDVAKAVATVHVKQRFNMTLTPVYSDAPTDYDFPVIASIDQALPPRTKVTWKWLVGGVGKLTPAGNDADSRSSAATFKSAAKGIGVVTVSADVTPPGGPTTTVLPQTARLNVKRGVTQLVLNPPQAVFACTDPKACGAAAYTAFIVPVMPRAKLYAATFSKFDYAPCNRTRTWTAPVADGGGCDFPITYHPYDPSRPTDAWAVWSGFGETPDADGTCVVTITLRP